MKVLVVCSYNSGKIANYIKEQVYSLCELGFEMEYFLIKGKGIRGYLYNLPELLSHINLFKPDIIHAHYGLSGLLAVLQRKVPVITSFHGSDINNPRIRFYSMIAMKYSAWSIFVSNKLAILIGAKEKYSIISCGVDLNLFYSMKKLEARKMLSFDMEEKLVLFSGAFSNKVKNYPLANNAINSLKEWEQPNQVLKLIELKDFSRCQVNLLFNACDIALLTSYSEGSPNFIKEAMACNCPVVATDVGDINELFGETDGCYLASFNCQDVAEKMKRAFSFADDYPEGTLGRKRINELGLELSNTARKLYEIYSSIIVKH